MFNLTGSLTLGGIKFERTLSTSVPRECVGQIFIKYAPTVEFVPSIHGKHEGDAPRCILIVHNNHIRNKMGSV